MSNETQQETWNATHAQLLKSVADAQAKLLAGINALEERMNILGDNQVRVCKGLDLLTDQLEEPRRPVERLRTKRIVKPAAKRNRR